MTLPTEPPLVPVITYASGETVAGASSGARVLLALLATLHFLLGAPLVFGPIAGVIGDGFSGRFDPGGFVVLAMGLAVGGLDIAIGVWMLVRRPWTWRAAHVGLTVLCALELLVFIGGAALCVAYKHAQGWDGIALAIGIIFAGAGAVLFWLHALAKFALLRLGIRRAFGMGDTEPVGLHRGGMIAMMSLFGLAMLVGGLWFIAR